LSYLHLHFIEILINILIFIIIQILKCFIDCLLNFLLLIIKNLKLSNSFIKLLGSNLLIILFHHSNNLSHYFLRYLIVFLSL